jgi:gliding motility-associated-like protein
LFKRYILSFLLLLAFGIANATHNRAGEILYEKVAGTSNRYKFTVKIYTFVDAPGNSPVIDIDFGDNTTASVNRVDDGPNGKGVPIENGINLNEYIIEHDYAGVTVDGFIVSVTDLNRTTNIENIQNGAPQETAFYIETQFFNNINSSRSSPVLQNPPIDKGCVGKKYTHNPGAWDIEGDSLSYTLIPSEGIQGSEIAGYEFPQTSNVFQIDNATGDLTWDSPIREGEYNFAIKIEKWRNGVTAGYIVRDMQVAINDGCQNDPPVITAPKIICVEAGDTIDFMVTAKDPNPNDNLNLSGAGGPFNIIGNDAIFPLQFSFKDSIARNFIWITENVHVRKEPYLITYRANDQHPTNELTHMTSTQIIVTAPAPKNVQATALGTTASISWNPTFADLGSVSYEIYRKIDSTEIVLDSCQIGPPAGFSKIGTTNGVNSTSFQDSALQLGTEYCYLVVATYNIDGVQSKASEQVCVEVQRDVPIITHVTVDSTDSVKGQITVQWSKPDIDTVQLQGPHTYLVYKATNGGAFVFDTLIQGLNDTNYTDVNLNTKDNLYSYRIDYKSGEINVGSTDTAQEINPILTPTDNELTLTWTENVPWTNSSYVVYRYDSLTSTFDSLTTTANQTFTDTNLVNLINYCYRVKSIGKYDISGIINPIENYSKTICSQPIDNVLPCPPTVTVEPDCDLVTNTITWFRPTDSCGLDILLYNIYYKPTLDGTYSLLLADVADTVFVDSRLAAGTIAGCYRITSLDSVNNESVPSKEFCVDNCPIYELPNVFTPITVDGANDFFVPFPYRYIKSVNFKVFNRWGHQVFEATDPDLNWDGTHYKNNKPLSNGVYFYVIDINEIRLAGITTRKSKGFIHILD